MLFLLNVALAIIWVALTGEAHFINFLEGFLLSGLVIWVLYGTVDDPPPYRGFTRVRYRYLPRFIIYFCKELIIASLTVTYYIIAPQRKLTPGVVAVPLDLKTDLQITVLANLITLTPGTLSLDVSTDRQVIYVHTITMKDAQSFREGIKSGFEKRVLEILP